jgi:hypothetical protein
MRFSVSKLTLVTATAAFLVGAAAPVFAQTDASAPVATAPAGASNSKAAAKEAKKQARAQDRANRRAERKTARAKNTAELKRLEDAGYKPAQNDTDYPQNLQNAQKRSAAVGASQ